MGFSVFGILHGVTTGLLMLFLATVAPLVASILSHVLIHRRGAAWCVAMCSSFGAVWIPVLFVFGSDLTEEGFRVCLLGGGLAALFIALVVGTFAETAAKRRSQTGSPHRENEP